MPLVTPFQNSLRFAATIGDGTGTGATFAIAATALLTMQVQPQQLFQARSITTISTLMALCKQQTHPRLPPPH